MKRSLFAVLAALTLAAAPTPSAKPSPTMKPSPVASPSAQPTGAASIPPGSSTQFKVGVWTVHMSQVDVNFKSGDFSTPDKVVMQRVGGDVTGDRASGNYKTKIMTIYGHVIIHDTQGNFAGFSSTTPQKPQKAQGPATLTADQVHIDGNAKVYTATGHVHYVQADTTTDADNGTLNDPTHELDLTGNVHIVQGDRNMEADHVLYNTVSGQAHAEGNPVTLQFPSQINKSIATPRPIKVKVPGQKAPKPEPTASPSG